MNSSGDILIRNELVIDSYNIFTIFDDSGRYRSSNALISFSGSLELRHENFRVCLLRQCNENESDIIPASFSVALNDEISNE